MNHQTQQSPRVNLRRLRKLPWSISKIKGRRFINALKLYDRLIFGWLTYNMITPLLPSRKLQKALCKKGSLKIRRLRKVDGFSYTSYLLSSITPLPTTKPLKLESVSINRKADGYQSFAKYLTRKF